MNQWKEKKNGVLKGRANKFYLNKFKGNFYESTTNWTTVLIAVRKQSISRRHS